MLETVRSKAVRLGLIEHISRLNKKLGYRDGWVFSSRFSRSLTRLSELLQDLKDRKDHPPRTKGSRPVQICLIEQ